MRVLTIIVLDQTVEQDTGHGDSSTREVGVVVHALSDFNTSRRVDVTGEEGEDVVLHTSSSRVMSEKEEVDLQHHHDEP
jgi:hypothetical protein